MSELWRCDVCFELIDPVEGDERTVLAHQLDANDGETETTTVDLCAVCRPESLSAHIDWLTHSMGES